MAGEEDEPRATEGAPERAWTEPAGEQEGSLDSTAGVGEEHPRMTVVVAGSSGVGLVAPVPSLVAVAARRAGRADVLMTSPLDGVQAGGHRKERPEERSVRVMNRREAGHLDGARQ